MNNKENNAKKIAIKTGRSLGKTVQAGVETVQKSTELARKTVGTVNSAVGTVNASLQTATSGVKTVGKTANAVGNAANTSGKVLKTTGEIVESTGEFVTKGLQGVTSLFDRSRTIKQREAASGYNNNIGKIKGEQQKLKQEQQREQQKIKQEQNLATKKLKLEKQKLKQEQNLAISERKQKLNIEQSKREQQKKLNKLKQQKVRNSVLLKEKQFLDESSSVYVKMINELLTSDKFKNDEILVDIKLKSVKNRKKLWDYATKGKTNSGMIFKKNIKSELLKFIITNNEFKKELFLNSLVQKISEFIINKSNNSPNVNTVITSIVEEPTGGMRKYKNKKTRKYKKTRRNKKNKSRKLKNKKKF